MIGREYKTIKALRRGEVIDIEGIKLKMDTDGSGKEQDITPGDLYIAERNYPPGPKLLTAREVVTCSDKCCPMFIVPTTIDYCFDWGECVKIREA